MEVSGTCPVRRSVLDPILVEIWPWGSPPKGSADQRVEALGIRHPKRPLSYVMSTSTEKAGVCKLDKFQAGFGSGVVRELNLKKNGIVLLSKKRLF